MPPTNSVAPEITGTAVIGTVLSCSQGTWTGTAPFSYTYQWKRNGVNIAGATASTYTLVSDDSSQLITCAVTAANAAGNATAVSNTRVGLEAFTQSFAARTAPAPATADEQNYNTMLRSMNELGTLPETDTVFILSAHSTQACVINVRSESIMLVPVNSPSIVPYLGAAGDASSSYLRAMGYAPGFSVEHKAQRNWNWHSLYSLTDSRITAAEMGNDVISIGLWSTSGNRSNRCMTASTNSYPEATSKGFFETCRNDDGLLRSRTNGVERTVSLTSQAPTNTDLYVCGRNNAGVLATPSNRRIAIEMSGAYQPIERSLPLKQIIETYLTAIGVVL